MQTQSKQPCDRSLDDFARLVHTVTRAFDNIRARIIFELSSRTTSVLVG
jgi:hypothetical protein